MQFMCDLDRDICCVCFLVVWICFVGGINCWGIFFGYWDGGDVVCQFCGENGLWFGFVFYNIKSDLVL